MQLPTILLPLLTILTTTTALPLTRGTAYVLNHCKSPVSIWSTDTKTTTAYELNPHKTWSEPLHKDPTTGVAIKIGEDANDIWTGKPILHFSYSLNDHEGAIYYDVSSAYGVAPLFKGKKIALRGSTPGVPEIVWYGDEGQPSGTRRFVGDTDMFLTLCAE